MRKPTVGNSQQAAEGWRLPREVVLRNRLCLAAALFSQVFVMAGCATVDPDSLRQTLAQYMLKPNHKAIYYLTVDPYTTHSTWSQVSADAAEATAKAACYEQADASGVDRRYCVPWAVDDVQLYDPISQAVVDQQAADESIDQFNQQLPSLISAFQSF